MARRNQLAAMLTEVGQAVDEDLPPPTVADGAISPIQAHRAAGEGAEGLSSSGAARHVVRTVVSQEQHDLIRDVWGASVLESEQKCLVIVEAMRTVAEETRRVLQSAIVIGRNVAKMKEVLTVDEFETGLRESQRLFRGWSSSNIFKLMSIANFVDQNRFDPGSLPQSYSVLYEFTTLEAHDLDRAIKVGIFRPECRRHEIQVFKADLKVKTGASRNLVGSSIEAEMRRITRRLRELDREVLRLKRRYAELEKSKVG